MSTQVDYDTVAATFDNRYAWNEYAGVKRALTRFVARKSQSRRPAVLEVGCGTGHWLKYLPQSDVAVVGIDSSAGMLETARAGLPPGRLPLIHGRAEALPFQDSRFDRILCINALHHFRDSLAFVRETRRVVRSGGGVLIIGLDPHCGQDQWWIYDYFPETLVEDRKRHVAAAVIREWLKAAGFARPQTRMVQHFRRDLTVDDARRAGALERTSTSQFMVISDAEYLAGVDRVQASSRGSILRVDLRLFGTTAWVA